MFPLIHIESFFRRAFFREAEKGGAKRCAKSLRSDVNGVQSVCLFLAVLFAATLSATDTTTANGQDQQSLETLLQNNQSNGIGELIRQGTPQPQPPLSLNEAIERETRPTLSAPDSAFDQRSVLPDTRLPDTRSVPGGTVLSVPRPAPAEQVEFSVEPGDLVTLVSTEADLVGVLRMIAEHHGFNLVVGPGVTGLVTVQIRDAQWEEVLDAIVSVAGFHWHRKGNLLYVTAARAGEKGMGMTQGRYVQVYPLHYVSAKDIEPIIRSLLSLTGSVHMIESALDDQLKSFERIVVDDIAAVHQSVAGAIAQLDIMPPQVLVEAHILQIGLDDRNRNGINLETLARIGNTRFSIAGTGFATTGTTGPSLAVQLDGNDMDGLLEAIEETTNSRTLASPKLSVVNQQEARIQIGSRLPYTVSTINQSVAIESVEYLDVGIVLTVRPSITPDHKVLMEVSPKVSDGIPVGGSVNRFQEDTTELQTTILLPDGGGVIIGGLIRDKHTEEVARAPLFGRIPGLRHIFRKLERETGRDELVIALVAHIMHPCDCAPRVHEAVELSEAVRPYAQMELKIGNPEPLISEPGYHIPGP